MADFTQQFSANELSSLSKQELIALVLKQQSENNLSSANQYDDFCRQIAENFPNGAVAIMDHNLTYLHVAGEAMQLHGFTEEMFIGHSMKETFPNGELDQLKEKLQQSLLGKKVTTELNVDDQIYLVNINPLLSEHGVIDRILTVSQNITKQQTALRQAQESEVQFRTLAESIPGAVYITSSDQHRDVVFISEQVAALTGYSVEDFKAKRITPPELICADDWEIAEQILNKSLKDQQPYRLTYRIKHRDGHYRWIEEHGAEIVKDEKRYFQGVLLDISEKKYYEEDLKKQNELLKVVNAELDHFSYSVSHDLRAPLTSALGLLSLLKAEENTTQRNEYVEMTERCLDQLNNFIQEIINLTRNARTDLIVEEVDLQQMVNDVIASQQQNADYNQVEIRTDIHPTARWHTDRRRFRVVVNNLLSNAIRYCRTGHNPSFVHVSVAIEQERAVLEVRDNGIGIETAHKDKIFDMFYRAADHVPGSGLGLYLVKETVQKLTGHIKVDSRVNQGTTFTVQLPSLV